MRRFPSTPRIACLPRSSSFSSRRESWRHAATRSLTTMGRPMALVSVSMRAVSLTALPTTPNDSRSAVPTLPKITSPRCTPTPKPLARKPGRCDPCPAGFLLASRGLDGEDAEHCVADQLEDLAAACEDGAGRAIEIGVEERQEFVELEAL